MRVGCDGGEAVEETSLLTSAPPWIKISAHLAHSATHLKLAVSEQPALDYG